MPPPAPNPPPLPQRRATRPRAIRRRVFVRNTTAALKVGLDAIIVTGQATLATRTTKAHGAGPSTGAGEEAFAASPLSLSPAPSRQATPTPIRTTAIAPPNPGTRTTAAASMVKQTRTAAPIPSPRSPRFTAAQADIAVGRFPSPPKRGPRTPAAFTPPNMPALSPSSPMDASASPSPTYAARTRQAAGAALTRATNVAPNDATAAAAAPAATIDIGGAPKPAAKYPLPDWPHHFRELKRLLGHTPNGRPYGKGVRFLPKSDQEFRLIQRYLTQLEGASGITWFCYSLPAERSLKVAIRGLPADTDPALVEQELRELGYMPEHVRAIPARRGRPGCLMYAQPQRTSDLTTGIYEVRELLCMPGVIIEAWRGRKGPAQCHRCQQFPHSSHNCHRPIACVRCGGSHPARDCPRPLEEPPTCANCGEAHTANNAACAVFRKEARNRRAGTTARTITAARATTAATLQGEADAPGSLTAAANQPGQQQGRKRRRKRGGKRAKARKPSAPPTTTPPTTTSSATVQPLAQPAGPSKPTVVAAPKRGTKAKRVGVPHSAAQPARGPLDPRTTRVIGALNQVLMAIQEQRDPVPLILACIMELCTG
ncbi:kinesin-like protein KIF26A [Pararge aegeria]|uniref:kinesin-like protein KIF26A n=1 Tax=Pararge aegeria TaxID=116150 RepID=UPI0019D2BEC8|nr:kinesin-like protein KIF26A [Pararge aegeria]